MVARSERAGVGPETIPSPQGRAGRGWRRWSLGGRCVALPLVLTFDSLAASTAFCRWPKDWAGLGTLAASLSPSVPSPVDRPRLDTDTWLPTGAN